MVVVVVTVFVSTHSARSICSLDVLRDIKSSPSSHPTETVGPDRGRRVSVALIVDFGVEADGLGDPAGVKFPGKAAWVV